MQAKYVGLIFACPFGKEAEDCPLGEIREKEVMSRVKWLLSLSSEESQNIVGWHQLCYERRLQEEVSG